MTTQGSQQYPKKDYISFEKQTDRFTSGGGGTNAGNSYYQTPQNFSNPCEDTFLADADPKYQDSQLLILCEAHKSQAVFYSNQQQMYKCFKCLLQEQDLIYIDKKFKKEMEEYERIKRMAAEAIQGNIGKMNSMKQWKNSIRAIIMDVRQMFLRWVDQFSNQLIESLKEIENSKDLKEFSGEDRRLNSQLEGLRDKYVQIMKIFTLISNSNAEQKAKVIDQHRNQMISIEAEIKKQDAYIVKQSAKMKEAQIKTVALDGLSIKLGQKYVAHFEKKLNHRNKNGTKQGNESVVSFNQTHIETGYGKAQPNSQVHQTIHSHNQISQPAQNLISSQQSLKSSASQLKPQIESSSRQGAIEKQSQNQQQNQQQIQQQRSNTIKSSATIKTEVQSQVSRNTQQNVQSSNSQKLQSSQQQQQQPIVQTSSQVKVQSGFSSQRGFNNNNNTLDLDVSEIRAQSSNMNTQGNGDPTLSIIPEIIESSNTQNTIQPKFSQQKSSKYFEEEKVQTNQTQNKQSQSNQNKQSITNNQRDMSLSNLIDQSSISYRYRHKNQNSIYFLKPRSNEIYLLDFKMQSFVKEQIKSLTLIPTAFASVQLSNGNIILLGGQSQDKQVSKSCWEIDTNMNMIEKASMKIGRFNLAIALLFDKYVFAIGGNTAKGAQTDQVEVYDSSINTWYPVGSLNKERSCTTACVLTQRYIYIFPGQQSNSWSTIEFLDIGLTIDPKELKKSKWNLVNVSNQDFNVTFAYGSAQISQTEILVFGGSKMQCFLLDTAVIQQMLKNKKDLKKQSTEGSAILTTMKQSNLCTEGWFGYESDFMARIYGNYLYALDQHAGNLHVYSIKDKQWNFSALKDLGLQ